MSSILDYRAARAEERRLMAEALEALGENSSLMLAEDASSLPSDENPGDVGPTDFFWLHEAVAAGAVTLVEEGKPDWFGFCQSFGGVIALRKLVRGPVGLMMVEQADNYVAACAETAVPGVTWTMSYGNDDGSHKEGATVEYMLEKMRKHCKYHREKMQLAVTRLAAGETLYPGVYD